MMRRPAGRPGNNKLFRYALLLACAIVSVLALAIYLFWSSSLSNRKHSSSSATQSHNGIFNSAVLQEQQQQQQREVDNTVPPLSNVIKTPRNDQRQQQKGRAVNNKDSSASSSSAGAGASSYSGPGVVGRLCALVLDARPVIAHRPSTPAETLQLQQVVQATAEAILEFENQDLPNAERLTQKQRQDGIVFVFSPFAQQPPLPSDFFTAAGPAATRAARELKLSAETLSRISKQNDKNNTFIEGVERIQLAIEETTQPQRGNCSSLFVVNAVMATSNSQTAATLLKNNNNGGGGAAQQQEEDEDQILLDEQQSPLGSLKGVIKMMVMHPATGGYVQGIGTPQRQQPDRNGGRWVLTPLIVSSNAARLKRQMKLLKIKMQKRAAMKDGSGNAAAAAALDNEIDEELAAQTNKVTHNIFSFGNDVVELYEGFAWTTPRFYGMPANFAPAATDARAHAPSGVLSYFTTPALSSVSAIVAKQLASPRYRAGRGWLEQVRRGINVDIPLSRHHFFETHLLAVDAALAEFAGSAIELNVNCLATRATVPPLVLEEDSVSARYMLAVAHASSGLGSVHLGIHLNNKSSSNNGNTAAAAAAKSNDPLRRDIHEKHFALTDPSKMVRAPAPWVARVLPFVASVASDLWFHFVAQHSIPNTTLFWDPYCSCTGINVEAVNFLVPLERFVRTRAVADHKCWCPGFPTSDQFALRRMSGPKLLATGSTSRFHVWVSHKPVDAFPTFPYDGAVQYGVYADNENGNQQQHHHHSRPDVIIGRTMIESDRISPDWVARLNADPPAVDELWVPSRFLVAAFRKSGVRDTLPIHVIPEAVDANYYDPAITPVHQDMDRRLIGCKSDRPFEQCIVFLSNFKWERRKGWDVLLRAYFTAFTDEDNVVLVLKTYLYMDSEPYSIDKIKNKIFSFARDQLPNLKLKRLPKIWIHAEETPAFQMLRIYRGADVFVLPTRGEGWGLPLQEAMVMGRVVIGTRWGGNLDFMSESGDGKSHLLLNITGLETADGQQVPMDPTAREKAGHGKTPLFASPNPTHLRDLMRAVALGMTPRMRAEMGHLARMSVATYFGRAPVAERVLRRLGELYRERHPRK